MVNKIYRRPGSNLAFEYPHSPPITFVPGYESSNKTALKFYFPRLEFTDNDFKIYEVLLQQTKNPDQAAELYRAFRIKDGMYCVNGVSIYGLSFWKYKETPKTMYDERYPMFKFYNYAEDVLNSPLWYADCEKVLKAKYPAVSQKDVMIFCDIRAYTYTHTMSMAAAVTAPLFLDVHSHPEYDFQQKKSVTVIDGYNMKFYNGKGNSSLMDNIALKTFHDYKAFSGTKAPSATAAASAQTEAETIKKAQAAAIQKSSQAALTAVTKLQEPVKILTDKIKENIPLIVVGIAGITGLYYMQNRG